MKRNVVIFASFICILLVLPLNGQEKVRIEKDLLGEGNRVSSEAYKTNKGILEIIREKKILSERQIKELLDPVKLTGLDGTKYPKK